MYYYILIFMYIFAFKIFSILDSAILVGIILTGLLIKDKEYRRKFLNDINNSKDVRNTFLCAVFIITWGLLVAALNKVLDVTYLKTFVHLLISIFIGYEIIEYLKYKNKTNQILNYVIGAFIIQSVLQWIFFLLPDVSKLFNIFRTEGMIQNNIKYNGYRGIAIASSGFFSLSSAYGLVAILYFSKYNTLFNNKILKYLMFILLYSGTFFAGRTGFVALIFIIPITVIKIIKNWDKIKKKQNKKNILYVIIITLAIIGLIVITMRIPKFSNMYKYAFELVKNIVTGKGIKTTSTDKLIKMYDIDFSGKTFFIGDGKYTVYENEKTSYYMHTDVGYYRKILYFGVVGLILSTIFQLSLFGKRFKSFECIGIMIFFGILELKGEIIGINIMINSMIILYSAICLKGEKENAKSNSANDYIQ